MIVRPIKAFYANSTSIGGPFTSYGEDVRSRHSNEFEACLLYLRDFMHAIDAEDMETIHNLRKHRNDLAHDLVGRLPTLRIANHKSLWDKVDQTLFTLSNYHTVLEIGAEPELQGIGVEWETVKGHEYLLFEVIIEKVKAFLK